MICPECCDLPWFRPEVGPCECGEEFAPELIERDREDTKHGEGQLVAGGEIQ